MKIAVIGYSGSGKSTLSRKLGEKYGLPVLHIDTVEFKPNWVIRSLPEKQRIVAEFLSQNDSWVIDGNYGKLHFWERMEQADKIIMLQFSRLQSLLRVIRRYQMYKGESSRPDMAKGCPEKLDFEFIWRVVYGGRKKELLDRYKKVIDLYSQKTIHLNTQKQIDAFWEDEEQARLFSSLHL